MTRGPRNEDAEPIPPLSRWWHRWPVLVRWASFLMILVLLKVSDGDSWSFAFETSVGFLVTMIVGLFCFDLVECLFRWVLRRRPEQEVLRTPAQES